MRPSLWVALALLSLLAGSPLCSAAVVHDDAKRHRTVSSSTRSNSSTSTRIRQLSYDNLLPSLNTGGNIVSPRLTSRSPPKTGKTDGHAEDTDAKHQLLLRRPPRGGGACAQTGAIPAKGSGGVAHTARVLGYFALWYALNVWYNLVNKRVLNALSMPISVAVAQLGIGSLWIGLQWAIGVRRGPGKLTLDGAARVAPVAFFHGGGQLATVLSLGAGAVSFTHVVKAMEPFFSAVVAAACFGQVFRPQVYVSLLPVVSGVALACLKEINFSWLSFLAAMASNLMFACRANFSKELMVAPPTQGGASLSPANLYGLVTMAAFLLFSPVAIWTGYNAWGPTWDLAMKNGHDERMLALSVVLSGLSHYLNNEVMYLALGAVHPTTLAVGNTFKRVFIIAASLVVFKTPISRMGVLGSAIAVGGVLVYRLTKQHYDSLDQRISEETKRR